MQKENSLRRLPRNVWAMSATSLLNDVSSEMLLNLIPFFLANILGVRTAIIGLIEGVAETTLRFAEGRSRTTSPVAALGPEIKTRTLVVNTCSKAYAMTGWRVGYLAAPEPFARALIEPRPTRCSARTPRVA